MILTAILIIGVDDAGKVVHTDIYKLSDNLRVDEEMRSVAKEFLDIRSGDPGNDYAIYSKGWITDKNKPVPKYFEAVNEIERVRVEAVTLRSVDISVSMNMQ